MRARPPPSVSAMARTRASRSSVSTRSRYRGTYDSSLYARAEKLVCGARPCDRARAGSSSMRRICTCELLGIGEGRPCPAALDELEIGAKRPSQYWNALAVRLDHRQAERLVAARRAMTAVAPSYKRASASPDWKPTNARADCPPRARRAAPLRALAGNARSAPSNDSERSMTSSSPLSDSTRPDEEEVGTLAAR